MSDSTPVAVMLRIPRDLKALLVEYADGEGLSINAAAIVILARTLKPRRRRRRA